MRKGQELKLRMCARVAWKAYLWRPDHPQPTEDSHSSAYQAVVYR